MAILCLRPQIVATSTPIPFMPRAFREAGCFLDLRPKERIAFGSTDLNLFKQQLQANQLSADLSFQVDR